MEIQNKIILFVKSLIFIDMINTDISFHSINATILDCMVMVGVPAEQIGKVFIALSNVLYRNESEEKALSKMDKAERYYFSVLIEYARSKMEKNKKQRSGLKQYNKTEKEKEEKEEIER